MTKAIKALRAHSEPPEGNPIRLIMDHHGLGLRDAEFIADLLEESGLDLWETPEGDLKHEAGLMISWINKNGDWPE